MTTVPISKITLNREDRQRRELKNIKELAASLKEIGMINPIVVDETYNLMAGERRFAAATMLGWDAVPITIFSSLTPAQQQLLELEENVKREALEWKDHCAAIARYHALRKAENPDWSSTQSSEALGISRTAFHYRMHVQEALEAGDELVVNAERYSIARGIVERKKQRAGVQDEQKVTDIIGDMVSPSAALADTGRAETGGGSDDVGKVAASFGFELLHENFHEWAATTEERDYNFIHCDFPYGVNADKHNNGAAGRFGGYSDTADVYWNLLHDLDTAMQRGVVAKSAHLMFWFSMDYYTETKKRLEDMGWKVNAFPLYWYKSDNHGIIPDPKRGPRRNTETAFIGSLADRFVVQAVSNTFPHPNTKTIHMSEKPKEMLSHFFRMFVDDSSKMLDPTMGSGNAVRVAYESGANHCTGLEMNEEFFLSACHANDDLMGD